MKVKLKLAALGISAVLLGSIGISPALAADQQNNAILRGNIEKNKALLKPGFDKVLKPDLASDIILDNVEVIGLENGVKIKVKSTVKDQSDPIQYSIQIDPEKGTYKTVRHLIPLSDNPDGQYQAAATSYSAWGKLTTYDPAYIQLNATKETLNWKDNGGNISYVSHALSTWAANPTPLGTHWYKGNNQIFSPWIDNDFHQWIEQDCYAQYWNTDFLTSARTDVEHDLYITATNSTSRAYSFDYDINLTGEAYWLLRVDPTQG